MLDRCCQMLLARSEGALLYQEGVGTGNGFIREKDDTIWKKNFSFFDHLTYLVWVARSAKSVYIQNILI